MIRKYVNATGLIFLIFSLTSCLEKPADPQSETDQLFRPVLFTASANGATVTFNWVPIKGATYLLEVSSDTLLFTNELQAIPLGEVTGYTLGDLWSNRFYSARVTAVSKDKSIKDSGYQTVTFVTGTENIFYGIDPAKLTESSVVLNWAADKKVTEIRVFSGENPEQTVIPGTSEKETGSVVIKGLKPATSYSFRIYNGEKLRGTVQAVTRAAAGQ